MTPILAIAACALLVPLVCLMLGNRGVQWSESPNPCRQEPTIASALPGHIITFPDELTPQQREEIRREWEAAHSGVSGVCVLHSGTNITGKR